MSLAKNSDGHSDDTVTVEAKTVTVAVKNALTVYICNFNSYRH